MEVSEVSFTRVKNESDDFRIHSEFFQRKYLCNSAKLSNIEKILPLNEMAKVSDGDHAKFPDNQLREVRYLQARDINNFFLEVVSDSYVSNDYLNKNKRSLIGPENILLSIMGTVGDITITPKDFGNAMCNRALAIIKNIEGINPQFLFAFLISKTALIEIDRLTNGGVQQRVNLDVLGKIDIPILTPNFQEKISNLVLLAQDTRKNSKQTYTQAENLLLAEIGLQDFSLSNEAVNIKSFSDSFGTSGRLDAEYYQKKYDDLEAILTKEKYQKISEIKVSNHRGLQPKYFEHGNLDIINSKHILDNFLDYNNFQKTHIEYWETQQKARVYKNDILTYTTGANIGRTQVYNSDKKALASNHVNILRINDRINPVYVAFFMNSLSGRLQTEKLCAGSAQEELYPKDVDEFIIPLIDKKSQQKISDLVEQSFDLKKESEHLLEVAKRAVEIAIEEDESSALDFISREAV